MKPVYLALTLSIAALMGCSNASNTTSASSNSSDKSDQAGAIEAKKYEPCVIPEVEGYQQVGCLRDGLAGVVSRNDADPYTMTNRVGYVDQQGKLVIPFEYDGIMEGEGGEGITFNNFSEGLAAVVKNEKYGFIDTEGKVVIPLDYDWVSDFSEGLAVVRINERYGAIDKTGKVVIPVKYGSLGDFNEGFAFAAYPSQDMDYKYGLIDKNNKEVIPFMYQQMGNFSEGLVAVQKEGKWGYVNEENKPIIAIDLDYEQVNDFADGLAAVFDFEQNSDNMKYGYIDKTGKLVIPMSFTRVYWDDSEGKIDFKNGYALVNDSEGNEFCIDTKGKKAECPAGIDSSHKYFNDDSVEDEINQKLQNQSQSSSAGSARFAAITDYLVLKPGQKWTWEQLTALPNVQGWQNKTPEKNKYMPSDPNYSINADLSETGYMIAYGTKQQPKLVTLGSGQGIMEDEELRGVHDITDFFNSKNLIRIPSNCDVDDVLEQKFYKWQKEGAKPLYVYKAVMAGNSGTTAQYGIAESLDEFFKPQYEYTELELHSVDNDYNHVVCTFDE
ncbi:WG repeat-containing protein [Psychrobacter sp. UBA3962]|uniref:WG repeat-containing protein n=1 Tax=Psychrobacter sp. UBA3962 TaxID=1947352 RepID=UPI0025F38A2E|nr:WG repeat-containing protein [Psychrobacter sp. UBA3962]